jgi:cyclic pyranopterin phosphate synthase
MDEWRVDGHKLNYHPDRVGDWTRGVNVFPIYVEISPTGICNHRCVFCGLDFAGYENRSLANDVLRERLAEMGQLGIRSVMYGGEGEPLLHRRMAELAEHTKRSGIDVAFTTNAVALRPDVAEVIVPCSEWIKASINAGTPETYSVIHRTKAADFQHVIDNMRRAREIKDATGSRCVLGMQAILLPENRQEMTTLARVARDIGMDYLVVKPYSQHPQSHTERYRDLMYDDTQALADELSPLGGHGFSVIVRVNAIARSAENDRGYRRCQALPFWSYIDAGGGVWGCSVFLGDERFLYGNINTQTFKEIWEGERRAASLRWVAEELDPTDCRLNCRMDLVNRYLWDLRNPPRHVNFI